MRLICTLECCYPMGFCMIFQTLRSLIIEKLKLLCVKRMRFLVSLSLESKKRQKFEKSIYSKSQYFLSVSSLLFSRLFSSLRKRIYLHLLQIWPQGTIFLAPLRYWSSTSKIASMAKNEFRIDFKIDRQTAIYLSSTPFSRPQQNKKFRRKLTILRNEQF